MKSGATDGTPDPSGVTAALAAATRSTNLLGVVPDPIAQEVLASKSLELLGEELAGHGIRDLQPFAAGASSVVLRAGEKVVRLGLGDPVHRPAIPEVLQAERSGAVGFIRYEVLPKVDTDGITDAEVQALQERLQASGYEWGDAAPDNAGRHEGRLVVTDPGGVRALAIAPNLPKRSNMSERDVTGQTSNDLSEVAAEHRIEGRFEAAFDGMDEKTAQEWARLDVQDFGLLRDDELARFAAGTIDNNFANPAYKAEFEKVGAGLLGRLAERNAANAELIAAKELRKEREYAGMIEATKERARRWSPTEAAERAKKDVSDLLVLAGPSMIESYAQQEPPTLLPPGATRPSITPADKQIAEALRLVRVAKDFPAQRFQEGVLDASADESLGFHLPSDWTGRVQTKRVMIESDGQVQWAEGAAAGLQSIGVYAQTRDNTFQWLADVPTQHRADELADRLAVIDAYAIDNEQDQAVAFAQIHEGRVQRSERHYLLSDIALYAGANSAYRESLQQVAPDLAAELAINETAVTSGKVVSGTYIGKVTALSGDHMEQKIGRDPSNVMVHDRRALSGDDVSIGNVVTVSYEMGRGRLRNHDLAVEQRGMGR